MNKEKIETPYEKQLEQMIKTEEIKNKVLLEVIETLVPLGYSVAQIHDSIIIKKDPNL